MQPLGANQIDLQLPDSTKDAVAEAGVAKSGLVRCATLLKKACSSICQSLCPQIVLILNNKPILVVERAGVLPWTIKP